MDSSDTLVVQQTEVNGFTCDFAPDNWKQMAGDMVEPSSYITFDPINASWVKLTGTDNPNSESEPTQICIQITAKCNQTLSFDWYYDMQDPTLETDSFGYSVNDVFVNLTNGANGEPGITGCDNKTYNYNGNVLITMQAGDLLRLCLINNSNTDSYPSSTLICNWHVVYEKCKFVGVQCKNLILPCLALTPEMWTTPLPQSMNEAIDRLAIALSSLQDNLKEAGVDIPKVLP